MLDGKNATSVEELQRWWMDPYKQWYAAGMPVFVTAELKPEKQITIKFKTKEDRQAFADLINQQLTDKTNMIYYPEKQRAKNNMNRIEGD